MTAKAPGAGAAPGFPASVAEITPDWLTLVLRRTGLPPSGRVLSADATQIGQQQSFTGGTLYRIALTLDAPAPAIPASVVVKLAPSDPAMRAAMAPLNLAEVHFYRSLSGQAALPVPRCHHAAGDAATGASILVLQDLTAARTVPFTLGCGAEDALRVVTALARLHAACWNNPALADLSGSTILTAFPFAQLWADYPARLRAILPDVVLPDDFLRLGDLVARQADTVFARLMDASPLTCLHRDPQVDNVMFIAGNGPDGGQAEGAVLLDWQLAGRGRGGCDLAYFLISSLEPPMRRACEEEMLARYHALLLRGGVQDYSLAALRADYRLAAVAKLLVTVAATVRLDNSGSAKADWRRADLRRLLAFCADHRVLALLQDDG